MKHIRLRMIRRRSVGLTIALLVASNPLVKGQEPEVANEDEVVELSPFEVDARSLQGYIAGETLGGSKIAKRLINIPQMVTIVNRDFIDDTLGFDRVIDSLKLFDPGIQNQGPSNPNYLIRGFRSNDHAIDGLAQRSLNTLPMSMVQAVEVVKGPAAMLYGPHASVGGYVNRILVKPLRTPQHKVGVVLGTDNFKLGYVDLNTPLPNDLDWIQLRFNAQYLDREFAYNDSDYREDFSWRLAANFDFSKEVQLRVAIMHLDQEYRIHRAPLNPDTGKIMNNFSVSGNDRKAVSQEDSWFIQAELTATPSEIFSFNMKYFGDISTSATVFVRANDPYPRYTDDDSLFLIYRQANWNLPYGMTPGDDVDKFDPNRVNHTVESTALFKLEPENFPLVSETLIGGTFEKEQRDQDRWDTRRPGASRVTYDRNTVPDTDVNGGGVTDMRNPDFGPLNANPWFRADAYQLKASTYIHEQLSFWENKLQLVYGLRWDYVEAQRYDFTPTNSTGPIQLPEDTRNRLEDFTSGVHDFSNVSDRYGIIVQPLEGTSLYFGHSEAFQDNGPGALTGGGLAPPQEISGDEFGFKFDMFHGFSGTVAFFDIEITNRVRTDPDNPGFRILDPDPITNDGFEISLAYKWESLVLLAGYYSGEVIDQRTGNRDSTQYSVAWNFWAKYQFDDWVPGLSAGAGVSYEGTKEGVNKGSRNGVANQPGVHFYDAFLAYKHENWTFRFAANNITDEYSVGNIINRTRVGYGRPREFKFSVIYNF